MAAPVEHKVTAGVTGAGAGGVVGGFVSWLLGRYVFHGGVPPEVSTFVLFLVPALLAFVGGWLAPHTKRATDVVKAAEAEAEKVGVSVTVDPDVVSRIVAELEARLPAPAQPEPETGDEPAPAAAVLPAWHQTYPPTASA